MHSKVPWKATNNGNFWEVQAPRPDESEPLYHSPSVAFVWDVGADTSEYNAKLIAAAPELLEALKELLAARHSPLEIVGHDPITGHPLNREGMAALKAEQAIAKAGGNYDR